MRSYRANMAVACAAVALVAATTIPGRSLAVSAVSADCDDAPPPNAVPTAGGHCELVYGQGGSFTTGIQNKGGVSARSLYFPNKIVVDRSGDGNLYVADMFNSRILFYPHGRTTATRVWGQGPQGNHLSSNAPD